MPIIKKCLVCNKEFKSYPCRIGRFCSPKCAIFYKVKNNILSMENNPNWKGGRKNHAGYTLIRTAKNLYEFQHRVVMEKHLKRKLRSSEYVHHINGKKSDNRIENLAVYKGREHVKIHNDMRHRCPTCGKFLQDSIWRSINSKLV